MLTSDSKIIKERFAADLLLFDSTPRYNIAPTQTVSVIVSEKERSLEGYRWGLVPHWAKDLSVGSKMINARAETLLERPAYKPAFLRRRCLIPANGFYEWLKSGDSPGPRRFELTDRRLFAFAGLWESWTSPDGCELRTCTIITTAANNVVRPVHDRMPAILSEVDEDIWLRPDSKPADLLPLLLTNEDLFLNVTAVTKRLNNAGYDGPELLAAV